MSNSFVKKSSTLNKNVKNTNFSSNNSKHWSEDIHECSVCIGAIGTLNLPIYGGSENGEFAYFENLVQEKITYLNGCLENGDIILEIQGQKVAGFTQKDIVAWLNHSCKNGNPVKIQVTRGGFLNCSLRIHLNTRFLKGSPDYILQNTVRDNLYLRTVPCTTRLPKEGEIDGVDYTFLTLEEFMKLELSGSLLESGIYEGNHYGTPRPLKESPLFTAQHSDLFNSMNGVLGNHPSSEGKRRRNRSSVEAMTAKGEMFFAVNCSGTNSNTECSQLAPGNRNVEDQKGMESNKSLLQPLPENWEKSYTEKGEPYFIDHNTGTSQWLDPRLSKEEESISQNESSELPYGWERIDDPHYGTYFIDHINKRTQYENPLLQAKNAAGSIEEQKSQKSVYYKESITSTDEKNCTISDENSSVECQSNSTSFQRKSNKSSEKGLKNTAYPSYVFTRNPSELVGKIIQTSLVKSHRGFGFTIVGGDDGDIEEFLQIKDVVLNGPAWEDGKLSTGDVLVFINGVCVLGYSHQDVVLLFQSIPPGETVHLEICQGYPLPFDPDDPNTEIVTTVAVSTNNDSTADNDITHQTCPENVDSSGIQSHSTKSLPDLNVKPLHLSQRHNSADLISNTSGHELSSNVQNFTNHPNRADLFSFDIVKGKSGFGFTVADSVYGQKVKKILDKSRCMYLHESDILIEINYKNIQGLSHADVVQMLKDCPCDEVAHITIQRGGISKRIRGDVSSSYIRYSTSSNSSHSGSPLAKKQTDVSSMYRSKTPTADLYSSRDKELINISRPKTPLIDTRYWPKHSASEILQCNAEYSPRSTYRSTSTIGNQSLSSKSNFSVANEASDYLKQQSIPGYLQENDMANRPVGLYTSWHHDQTCVPRTVSTSVHTGPNSTWYTTLGRLKETYWANNTKDSNKSNCSSPVQIMPEPQNANLIYSCAQVQMSLASPSPVLSQLQNQSVGLHDNSGFLYDGYIYPSKRKDVYTSLLEGRDWDCSLKNRNEKVCSSDFNSPHSLSEQYADTTANSQVLASDIFCSHSSSTSYSVNENQYNGIYQQKHSTSFETEQPSSTLLMNRNDSIYTDSTDIQQQQTSHTPSHAGSISEYMEMTVTLQRQESGFGFRIIGGTEEGSQVSIGHIVPGGAADLDGCLHTGDEIVSVDNHTVLNTSHHQVVHLMGTAAANGRVVLGVRRKSTLNESAYYGGIAEKIYPYDVTVCRQENEGFGFVIISSASKAGSTIGRIIEDSPADRCGQLHVGDRILAVNKINILNIHHGHIVNLIKDSGYTVTLTIGSFQDDTSSLTSTSQRGDEHFLQPDEQYHAVELYRGTKGFGFSIRGGQEFQNMPLYVLRIAENGPAKESGKLLVGDQIIEINSINTKHMTHAEAIELIRQGDSVVRLLVKRTNHMSHTTVSGTSQLIATRAMHFHHPISTTDYSIPSNPSDLSDTYYS